MFLTPVASKAADRDLGIGRTCDTRCRSRCYCRISQLRIDLLGHGDHGASDRFMLIVIAGKIAFYVAEGALDAQ